MKYLLDTNICSYIIHDRSERLRKHFRKFRYGDVGISAITLSELHHGVAVSADADRNAGILETFLSPLIIAPYDADAAQHYGRVQAELKKKGTTIETMDLLIAAHALALDTILVTNNTRDCRRVPGLRIENWTDQH